jgi:hypothetical protein
MGGERRRDWNDRAVEGRKEVREILIVEINMEKSRVNS